MNTPNSYYLVTFTGIPDWEEGQTTQICSRKYLFSSQMKAASFVRRRTLGSGWYTHPAHKKGSMMLRLKHNSPNRYCIILLTVDEVYDEANAPENTP